jgi:dTDP-3-amino-3,4,6-trideoxy-alpha-D-glucose transaminase
MDWLDDEISERRRIMSLYRELLGGLDEVLKFQKVPKKANPAWHLIVCRTSERDALRVWLANRDVETMVHYPTPCHEQGAVQSLVLDPASIVNASALSRELVSLPMWPGMPEEGVEQVCAHVAAFFDHR